MRFLLLMPKTNGNPSILRSEVRVVVLESEVRVVILLKALLLDKLMHLE